jgi:hypothetical protein
MAITYKGERYGGPLTVDADNNATVSRVLRFHFNGAEKPLAIYAQSQIPARGSAHPDDASFKLTSITIDRAEGDMVSGAYDATLVYSRQGAGNTAQDSTVAPWRRRPYDISLPSQEVVVPFQKSYLSGDKNGSPSLPVLNPAGDPYEDSTSLYRPVLKFSYNLETFDDAWIPLYNDTVNKTAETVLDIIIPAQRGRVKSLFPTYAEEYNPVDEPQKLNLDGTLYDASLTGAAYNVFFDKFFADWKPLGLPKTTRG